MHDGWNLLLNTFTYNANGVRISKNCANVQHDYVVDGTKILKETWGENVLIPLYDNEDSVCGAYYNGYAYYFQKNLQGDVIAVYDQNDYLVARYSYDAWGKVSKTVYPSACSEFGEINPFLYRGYYYDWETGLYYLQSRYYDPELGRFLNADEAEFVTIDSKPTTTNLFCYCENNPINNTDAFGNIAARIVSAIACGILSALTDAVCQMFINYLKFKKKYKHTPKISQCTKGFSWGTFVVSAIGGALSGLLLASRFKTLIVALGSGIISSFVGIVNGIICGLNIKHIIVFAIIDFGVAALIAAISKGSFAYKYYNKISSYFYVRGKDLVRMCMPVFKDFMKALSYTIVNNIINLFTGVIRGVI